MAKAKVKIKPNDKGIQQLLNDPGIQGVVDSAANRVRYALPAGYEIVRGDGTRTRYRAMVVTETGEAKQDNARNASLLRALGAA
ncbi:hypothetical protein [Nesterenkonia sp.]|uniref:hypothetical protein n=1 Tax=Nesterenkonia sp. TaxID=704201 RepID=UPI0026232136|nr:hypothetical protein [Nesterenkonia sp.]